MKSVLSKRNLIEFGVWKKKQVEAFDGAPGKKMENLKNYRLYLTMSATVATSSANSIGLDKCF